MEVNLRRYLRMYWSFLKNCLIREMEFRWNFLLYSFINLIWAALALLTFVFIFNHVTTVAGWTLEQMLLLTATFYFFDRVFDALFEVNFSRFNYLVNRGELDLILTKPVSAQFSLSLRQFSFASIFGALSMLILVIWLVVRYFWPVPLTQLVLYAGLIGLGLVIIYSFWFSTLILVFWLGNIENIQHLFRPIYEIARIPTEITGVIFKPLLTYVIPLAFVATIPAQSLIGTLSPWLIVYGVFAAAFLLWLSHRLWNFALRHYTSASS